MTMTTTDEYAEMKARTDRASELADEARGSYDRHITEHGC
jgi:hypothetical protein